MPRFSAVSGRCFEDILDVASVLPYEGNGPRLRVVKAACLLAKGFDADPVQMPLGPLIERMMNFVLAWPDRPPMPLEAIKARVLLGQAESTGLVTVGGTRQDGPWDD
jgi:hypothetical protein